MSFKMTSDNERQEKIDIDRFNAAQIQVKAWNRENPMGTHVLYWVAGALKEAIPTETRSIAWALNGEAVVLIKGLGGGIPLEKLTVEEVGL